jgi:hypothetical protein
MRLRRDCRPICGNGPGGYLWVRGQRLGFWGSQPGLEESIESVCCRELVLAFRAA